MPAKHSFPKLLGELIREKRLEVFANCMSKRMLVDKVRLFEVDVQMVFSSRGSQVKSFFLA